MTARRAKLGDRLNGYAAEKDGLFSLSEAVRWLCGEALQRCPHSNFASNTGSDTQVISRSIREHKAIRRRRFPPEDAAPRRL
jgi:hypothetical protein